MAAEIKEAFGAESKLIKGKDGIFDVRVDGDLIFSKYAVDRFPHSGEVVGLMKG